MLLLLLACAPPTDAERYAAALGGAKSWEEAAAGCAGVADPGLQGDCWVAITGRFGRLEAGDCAVIAAPLWASECRFALAERLWAAEREVEALAQCELTRFSRACSWHLLQDEAQAAADEHPAVAERRLEPLYDAPRAPDAPKQFWRIWHRELAIRGRVVDERHCAAVRRPRPCYAAVSMHVDEALRALDRATPGALCARAAGQRAVARGRPTWFFGPVAAKAESGWEASSCHGRVVNGGENAILEDGPPETLNKNDRPNALHLEP